jgi:hypothetical protein
MLIVIFLSGIMPSGVMLSVLGPWASMHASE